MREQSYPDSSLSAALKTAACIFEHLTLLVIGTCRRKMIGGRQSTLLPLVG